MTLDVSKGRYDLNEINHSILKLKAVRDNTDVVAVTAQIDLALPPLYEAHNILARAMLREWGWSEEKINEARARAKELHHG